MCGRTFPAGHRLTATDCRSGCTTLFCCTWDTHRGRKIDSIERLLAVVPSLTPKRFTQQTVLVWAVPQQSKGIQRAVVEVKAPKHRENKDEGQRDWRNKAADADMVRANKHARSVTE